MVDCQDNARRAKEVGQLWMFWVSDEADWGIDECSPEEPIEISRFKAVDWQGEGQLHIEEEAKKETAAVVTRNGK